MKRLFLPLLFVPLCGCAFLHSTTRDPVVQQVGTNYVVAYKKTSVRAYTLFDAQSNLTKFRNTTGANGTNGFVMAPGTSIGQYDSASTTTNLNEIIGAIVGAAVKAAVKP